MMERLTFEGNFCDIARCNGEYRMTSECADGPCDQRKVWERLKEYEDTGLEPEEIAAVVAPEVAALARALQRILDADQRIDLEEWIRADKEGRLVVLPCKVGDPVWFIRPGDRKLEITETTIEKMVVKSGGIYMKLACNAMYETSCRSIGKTVFLTREEAEKALEDTHET